MAGKTLTPEGIARAARRLGIDVAAVEAVIEVETLGDGFDELGRPRILYERHKFYSLTGHRAERSQWALEQPDLCNPRAGGYGKQSDQYPKLYRALQLDGEAAVEACSWGLGQVMGFNWRLTGERSLFGFLMAVHHNEDAQLALMVEFIRNAGGADELARHDWAGFARIYNGAGYARNSYDTRLAAAYRAARDRAGR